MGERGKRVIMDQHNHIPTSLVSMFLLFLINFPNSHSQPQPPPSPYDSCKEPYMCGHLNVSSYPFWGHGREPICGGGEQFELSCHHNYDTTIQIGSKSFTVEDIHNTTNTMRLKPREDYNVCSEPFLNTYVNLFRFQSPLPIDHVTIFAGCSNLSKFPYGYNFTCDGALHYFEVEDEELFKKFHLFENCTQHRNVPYEYLKLYISSSGGGVGDLNETLKKGFEVKYDVPEICTRCGQSNGRCWRDGSGEHVSCYYCPGPDSLACRKENKKVLKILIGVFSGVGGAVVVGILVYLCMRKKKNSYVMSYIQSRSLSSDPSSKDTEKGIQKSFTQSFVLAGVHLFTYDELEEATNHFDSSKELGEGGFGTVYFGKLRDGRSVAVKRLYENSYRRVEQFMNEIKILARLVHPNLVTLYGCTSRHSRELLLVYEYIPNGTVADHLHGQRSKPGKLPWHIRMNIAVETSSALKYLHHEEIIHRDVKTNNILLDTNFHVKVADFGLSRLFPEHVTHVSTAPQGTPGYVDPEYHECYQLTNKSDVYSFGVVLVELISSLPAVDITRHRHEINLANMAINKIHGQALHELVDPSLGFESDIKVRKMINAVAELAFQCLQSSKDMRPSMEEVVDTLKDIQSDGKHKSQPEVMDISSTADDVVLLKDDPPPPSPDSNAVSKSTTPNASG